LKNKAIIKSTALKTIEIEQKTVEMLKIGINDDFVQAVEMVFQMSGRLVVTGVGKSALIGQKIVATLNSTGTPAIFMHAADAIHGDLGMIQKGDVVLCISKSGTTTEVKVLVPLLKNMGNLLLGMTANPDSYLGTQADFCLHTPIQKEADPNNLAPTASTTAQVVMGDAMATALLALRGFTPQDFAQYHPGGALGKQLYLRVRDLSINNESPAVLHTANVRTTILEMTSKRLGCTAVLDANGNTLGIITDGDLRRMLAKEENTKHLTAEDIMTPSPLNIDEGELAVKALSLMRSKSITQLIVTKANKYAGILHLHDLIREGII